MKKGFIDKIRRTSLIISSSVRRAFRADFFHIGTGVGLGRLGSLAACNPNLFFRDRRTRLIRT